MKTVALEFTECELGDVIEGLDFLNSVMFSRGDDDSRKYAEEVLSLKRRLTKTFVENFPEEGE